MFLALASTENSGKDRKKQQYHNVQSKKVINVNSFSLIHNYKETTWSGGHHLGEEVQNELQALGIKAEISQGLPGPSVLPCSPHPGKMERDN